ncbi:unnamed protein product [Anisakis simplex]|uniref:Hunchback-like protein (inferred by orthology to a C. elegans protein) n=1 Tax=Anisakis simplex TaxID=6269 RepID=A0A0M3JVT7_ANISI|nr:unnamed protein product [Anisakis simplex]
MPYFSSLLLNLSQQQQRESVKNLSSSPIKTETSDSDINNNNNLNIGVDKQHHNQIVTTLAECHRIEEEPLLSEKLPTSCSVATPNSCTNSTSSVISTTSNSPPRSTPHSQPPLSISPILAEITTSTPPTGSFCRAPGLGPLPIPDLLNSSSSSSSQLPLVCAICGFSCNSKFHYNSHMNTHGDHQCTMCDYTSRTEGRLKKHMRDSHTIQEQMAAGLDVEIIASSSQLFSSSSTSLASNTQLGTTMTSVLEAANLAAATQLAAAMHAASSSSSTSPNYTSTPPSSTSDDHQTAITSSASHSLLPSALDQIRAFTENPSILPDLSSTNLASALMSHGLLGTAPPISEASTSSPTEEQQASASYSLTISGSSSERRSSGSKPKTYKCKQCSHVSASKEDQWVHARTHIPVEKQLGCTRCGFVTEYKHHLEYHLRNHMGSKPFHCKKCAYSCVNKSMLNSHMKSHTNVYQFRCRDCTYATKYCHSLKLHLKKYNHTRAGDANDSTVINGHHNTVSPFESANESDSLRRLSESYSMNGADEDTSPRPTSTIPTAQQSLANSTAMNLNPMVTSSSLNLASQLLLRQHQLEQMDVVMRMNGLSGGITPSAMLPNVSSTTTNSPAAVSRCALCNYQALNEEDNLRHQMTHLIAHQADPAATAASLYNSIASIQNCNNQPLTTTSPRVVNECDEKRRLSTSDGKLNDDDKEQMLERCFNNTSGDTHQTSPVESAKSSGDEGSLTAEEMCAEKGGGASKRKAGLKLNQIAARLHEKNSPGVDDMHIVDSTDCVTSERMDDDEKELSPLAVTLPISAPIASRPTPTRVLPTPLTFTTDTTNLNIFQQACIAHMQNMEQKLRSAFDMWRFSCPHCKMAFQDEPLFHIHMGYHGYENPFKCNRCGQACNDGLTFNLHLLQAKH